MLIDIYIEESSKKGGILDFQPPKEIEEILDSLHIMAKLLEYNFSFYSHHEDRAYDVYFECTSYNSHVMKSYSIWFCYEEDKITSVGFSVGSGSIYTVDDWDYESIYNKENPNLEDMIECLRVSLDYIK